MPDAPPEQRARRSRAAAEPLTGARAAAAPPPRPPVVVFDAVDAETAELAPVNFTTTDAKWAAGEATFQEGLVAGRFDEDAAPLAAEPEILPSSVTVKCGARTWTSLDGRALARGSSWFAGALASEFREAATRVFEFPFDAASGGARDAAPQAGLGVVLAWLTLPAPAPGAAEQLCESGDDLVAAARAAHFLGADALLAELEDVLVACARDQAAAPPPPHPPLAAAAGDDGGACVALLALADELRLARLRAEATKGAFALLERCERKAFFADEMDPETRAQLARVRALRDASAREGLGALGLPDAREYLAMLRETLEERRERYEEARALAAHDDTQLRARLTADGEARARLGVASVDAFADDAGRRTRQLLTAQAERIEAFARYVDTQEAVFASELESWGPVRKREAAPFDLANHLLSTWPAR